jgi:hypothetical protein
MPQSSSFSIRKPVSVWNQPLKADVKGLFSSLAKVGFHGFTGQWTELGIDAAEGLTALGIERDPLQLSWLLIRRSLFAAMSELVSERAPLTVEPSPSDLEDLSRRLDGEASGKGYTGLPQELSRPDLDEITAQPLLNYLVGDRPCRPSDSWGMDLALTRSKSWTGERARIEVSFVS